MPTSLLAKIIGFEGGSTLDSLPIDFSYVTPSPKIRRRVHKTADGGITVHSANNIKGVDLPGDGIITWRLQAASQREKFKFLDMYLFPTFQRTFKGYWGDEFEVLCLMMNDTPVRAQLFELSGEFQVLSTISWGRAE